MLSQVRVGHEEEDCVARRKEVVRRAHVAAKKEEEAPEGSDRFARVAANCVFGYVKDYVCFRDHSVTAGPKITQPDSMWGLPIDAAGPPLHSPLGTLRVWYAKWHHGLGF